MTPEEQPSPDQTAAGSANDEARARARVAQQIEAAKQAAGLVAATIVEDGQIVGLGTGSTMRYVIEALGERVRAGLRISGVPTSVRTADLARQQQIPLVDLDQVAGVDLALDGADEIDPWLGLVKGRGGALVREKIVAAASARFVVVADESKLVSVLGSRTPIPVAVVPFGWRQVQDALVRLGGAPTLRHVDNVVYVTDDGLYVLDCAFGAIADPDRLAVELRRVVGVVDHGLFLGMASEAIVGNLDGSVRSIERDTTTP